jgi:site-specific DNA-methyltransferase (adenine-specific)
MLVRGEYASSPIADEIPDRNLAAQKAAAVRSEEMSHMNPIAYVETGVIQCADNLESLRDLPSACIDVIYLDPPFFSNRNHQVVWGEEVRRFEDNVWHGSMNFYIDWMKKRAREMHRTLKPTGTLYFHCDWHASHHLKVMLDDLFGIGNFRNEIIWQRTLAKGQMTRRLPSNHDVLLVYQRGDGATWNEDAMFVKYDEGDLDAKTESKYSQRDQDGRRYQLTSLINPNPDRPNLTYEFLGIARVWRWTKERMEEAYANGLVVQTAPGRVPRLKRYLDEQRGRPFGDVWTDIPPLNSQAAEREGYPTQKPEELLERILKMSSNPGEIVLDPFCGCGTTIAVAEKLKRQWIGIDISPTAASVMKRRMDAIGAKDVRVDGLPVTVSDLKQLTPFEFQNWIVQRVLGSSSPRKSGDMGIDGLSFFEGLPIQVKQSERIGRKVVDEFETAIARHGSERGYLVAFSFGGGAIEEAARTRLAGGPEVVLVRVADVLRVGELVDAAERDGVDPDRAPDLMGLFSSKQRLAEDFPVFPAPPRAGRRKQKKKSPQMQLGLRSPSRSPGR